MHSERKIWSWILRAVWLVSFAILPSVASADPAAPANSAPTLNPIANMLVAQCGPGAIADQAISGSDPDGDPLTFSKVAGPTFMTVTTTSPTTGNILLAPTPADPPGTYTATVSVSDGLLSDSKSFSITVLAADPPPALNQPANMTVNEGATADQTISGSDPCGDVLFFSVVSGPSFMTVTRIGQVGNTAFGNVHLAPGFADSGFYTATVRVSDGVFFDEKSFTITVTNVNRAPVLNPIANMIVSCTTADQAISGSDPDGDPLVFSKVAGPTFMTVTTTSPTTGNIHLAPGFSDGGTYAATVSASDGSLSDSKSFSIAVLEVNQPPVLAQPASMTVNEGATADQTLTGSDPCGDPLTFSKAGGPSFMTVTTTTATTGNVHLAPGFADAGTYTATVRVSDGATFDQKSFTILVNPTDRAPTLVQPANMTVIEGATATQTLTAIDPDGDPLAFSKVGGPSFMTVTTTNPGTGTATGNVDLAPGFTDAGTYSASVSVTDGSLGDGKSFSITVLVCLGCGGLVLNQPANMTVNEGATANQALTATDSDGDPLTFSKVSGPTFMTVMTTNPGMGFATGTIHLEPGFADAGTYSAAVSVTDGLQSVEKSFSITVNDVCRSPVADPGGPYQGVLNAPITFDGTGSFSPIGETLSFVWDFDASDGLGVDAIGAIVSHTYSAEGIYTVTLTVTGTCGSDTGVTTATIAVFCAEAFTRGSDKTIRLSSGKPFSCVEIEPVGGCYNNADVLFSSIVMRYGGGEIHAVADKTALSSDIDRDGIQEITACFRKEDLRQLFAGLPAGENFVTVVIAGSLISGGQFAAELQLRIIASGGALAASVSPNPLNPSATLSFVTTRAGFARVRLYDLSGRIVRSLMEEPALAPGLHALTIDGRAGDGTPLASGIYYFRIEAVEGVEQGRFTLLK